MWQRSTVCRSWCRTKRAQIRREWPSTSENSQTMRVDARLVGEDDLEVGEVDLRLVARRGLEADLEGRRLARPHRAQEVASRRCSRRRSRAPDLAQQPRGGQARDRRRAARAGRRRRRRAARGRDWRGP